MPPLHVATFRVDVSVPIGHPLCGGWIRPAVHVTEPLYALGLILLGNEAPVVLCAVDYTGICNDAHVRWREAVARAAHTTPERVAVHCVHQHNAPFVDVRAERLIREQKSFASSLDLAWHDGVVQRVAAAVQKALAATQPVTHVSHAQAKVERVASNRRLIGKDGKLIGWRGSSCRDAKLRAAPEGLIDPWLRAVTLWNGDKPLAVLHYYATHPMSYYGDGLVTSDFVGLAREGRSKEHHVPHLYFTGCAGNVAAGKYNDGDRPNRFLLAHRVYDAMQRCQAEAPRRPVPGFHWRTEEVILPPRSDTTEAQLRRTVADPTKAKAVRNRAAMKLSYRLRAEAGIPIVLSSLHLGPEICLLHLPAECFVEYQLYANQQQPGRFIATAAYGDGGPWYIPIAEAFDQGGYEPSVAFTDPDSEAILKKGIDRLIA